MLCVTVTNHTPSQSSLRSIWTLTQCVLLEDKAETKQRGVMWSSQAHAVCTQQISSCSKTSREPLPPSVSEVNDQLCTTSEWLDTLGGYWVQPNKQEPCNAAATEGLDTFGANGLPCNHCCWQQSVSGASRQCSVLLDSKDSQVGQGVASDLAGQLACR